LSRGKKVTDLKKLTKNEIRSSYVQLRKDRQMPTEFPIIVKGKKLNAKVDSRNRMFIQGLAKERLRIGQVVKVDKKNGTCYLNIL